MKEEVFYKHVRETTFTKDYTVCGKVVKSELPNEFGASQEEFYELHIGVYVFPVDELFVKKRGCEASFSEAGFNPLLKIAVSEYSLHTFLDFCKIFVPNKAVKKKVVLEYTINK